MAPLAMISGATGGIGGCIVAHLWGAGYSIVGLGRNRAKMTAWQTWFCDNPRGAQQGSMLYWDACSHNLSGGGWLEDLVRTVTPEVLVVAHGAAPQPCKASDAEQSLRQVFEVDVMGTYTLCRIVGAQMVAQGRGSISILSSLHARATYPERVAYSTCKAALGGMVRSLAVDYGHDGVRINAIIPWQCSGERTEMVAASEGSNTIELYKQRSPLRCLVDPEDIARTVLWLTQCKTITGSEIVIDAGVSSSMWHKSFTGKEL